MNLCTSSSGRFATVQNMWPVKTSSLHTASVYSSILLWFFTTCRVSRGALTLSSANLIIQPIKTQVTITGQEGRSHWRLQIPMLRFRCKAMLTHLHTHTRSGPFCLPVLTLSRNINKNVSTCLCVSSHLHHQVDWVVRSTMLCCWEVRCRGWFGAACCQDVCWGWWWEGGGTDVELWPEEGWSWQSPQFFVF